MTTRFERYKIWAENNRVFSILLIAGFAFSAVGGLLSFGDRAINQIRSWFPSSSEAALRGAVAMASSGCIIFMPNGLEPVTDNAAIMAAYQDFWRSSDIYYAEELEVRGYWHWRGSREYNIGLAESRANRAVSLLTQKGHISLPITDATALSFGEERGLQRSGEYECGAEVIKKR